MFLITEWEMFYTDTEDADTIDQISIDTANRRYILDTNISFLAADGCDDEENEVSSTYVSRPIFNLLLEGLKQNGYRAASWE